MFVSAFKKRVVEKMCTGGGMGIGTLPDWKSWAILNCVSHNVQLKFIKKFY